MRTPPIKYRIGSAPDDDAVVFGQLAIVSVAPNAGERFEVGGAALFAVRVIPKPHRHGGEWCGANQLTLLPANGLPWSLKISTFMPSARLEFAAVDGANRVAQRKARDDISAT